LGIGTLRKKIFPLVFAALLLLPVGIQPAFAVPGDMIGSIGAKTSPNPGAITLVSQIDASQTLIGDPTLGGNTLSGVAFDSNQNLWGTENQDTLPSATNLLQINPFTGAQISSVPIRNAAGTPVSIQDLAVQPGTNVLFGSTQIGDLGFGHPALVTIDKSTGVASLVSLINTGSSSERNPIAFTPDGTFYFFTSPTGTLLILNPNDGSQQPGSVVINIGISGLGSRSDGILFGSNPGGLGGTGNIVSINPANGLITDIGPNTPNLISDLTFVPQDVTIGGTIIPIDTTSLLLVGAQMTAAWMIPVIIAGIGFAIVILRKL